MTGDTSPPPFLHVTDIHLYLSDSDTVRLTGDLMYSNLGSIVSVYLWGVHNPKRTMVQLLPKCPKLSALHIGYMGYKDNLSMKENHDLLVSVISRLTQLTTVWYEGDGLLSDDADRAVVAAVMSLTQLVWVYLWDVSLGDVGVGVTDAMTRLRTVMLVGVSMTAGAWDRFVSSLLALPQSVSVVLRRTNIDEGTVRRIQTSDRVTVTRDDEERDEVGQYEWLEFTTVPSQTA